MRKANKTITLTFHFHSSQKARHISACLIPEVKKEMRQITIDVVQKNDEVIITFSSDQTVMLRAAVNSYCRWIQTAHAVYSLEVKP